LVEIEPISSKIYPTAEADFGLDEDDEPVRETPAIAALSQWMDDQPAPPARELLNV
jgi:hypothetical protein